jgi:hypothetical protein
MGDSRRTARLVSFCTGLEGSHDSASPTASKVQFWTDSKGHPMTIKSSDVSGVVKKDHAEYARNLLITEGAAGEWEVVVADDLHLQVDVDAPELPPKFERVFALLCEHWKVSKHEISASKSGNLHVIIELVEPMKVWERIGWQAALGSDPMREALHYVSVLKHELNPILLFERKPEKRVVWSLPPVLKEEPCPTS